MPTTPEPVVPPTVQADTLNWMREQITRLNDLTVEGAEYEQVPGGRQLRIPKPPVGFWARVRKAGGSGSGSGSDSGSGICQPYDWWEQEPIGCGYFQDDEFGRVGTLENGDPAYSIPPDAFVPDDSIVWLTKGLAAITPEEELSGSGSGEVTEPVIQEWYFQLGAGGEGGSGAGSGDGIDCICSEIPVGWTDLGTSCEIDLIERTCFSDNTKGKRTVRICLTSDGFRVLVSPWTTDSDPAPDPP